MEGMAAALRSPPDPRRGVAVTVDPSSDNAGVRIVPPAVYLGGLAIGYVLDLVWHVPIAPPGLSLAVRLVGIVILALGVSIMLSAVALFRRLGTQLAPWEPTTRLALDG